MTKLPGRDTPVLLRECVAPLCDAMAGSLRCYLSRPRIVVAAPEAVPSEDASTADEIEWSK